MVRCTRCSSAEYGQINTDSGYVCPTCLLKQLALADKLAEAINERMPEEQQEHDWWCPTCQDWLGGNRVTCHECCDTCGTYLTDCQPEDWMAGTREALDAYKKARKSKNGQT